ncbi:AAA ATpase [Ectocarpus siliculosus]|uniref:Vesicle-fusing ATPase n=1 Tax=Ectocarpus siliculosus TaxID=2880 RepID=D7G1A9_ECTSI|nr:AAA ATpase [Ectocarpus siliculosus]|eukprot:CBJ33219.1 AAA ATpase [Ectocarpus siliculosus]
MVPSMVAFAISTAVMSAAADAASVGAAAAYGTQSARDSACSGEGPGGVAVHDDSWYLGDGGFAGRHLEDEDRLAAKKDEKAFFRERSLSVYDQMKEASMLLLAQQQLLAAEETREEASKPRFVAAAGGSMAARAQAARDRQRKRNVVRGLLPDAPAASGPASGAAPSPASRGAPVLIPVGPGMLSGDSLGVGGLDEELEEIRRRVCVPLAAPADLLEDLGISPVRGLLLHGPPGCGKTLLARRLSAALTPRPPAVVSGPEILERFVGSSEANIRALFDYPPDVPGGDESEQAEALHVIVMDEFDSIGQRRGGGDDGGDRVRDSVVNQLLARMDGFQELDRPTLLVALTNRIDLLDTALLRPGRFEVQVHIPGPDQSGREAILRIHTQRMHQAGRIDAPPPPDAEKKSGDGYSALVSSLAAATGGFTGAELAGLVRAAASYALERAVGGGGGSEATAAGCRVTAEDFGRGLADVTRSKSSAHASAPGGAARRKVAGASPAAAARLEREGENTIGAAAVVAAAEGGASEPKATAAAATSVSAAAVAAARSEGEIGGSLSPEDLASVQKLLLQKTSEREEEDVLLLDAAQVVAQRRKGGGGAGVEKEGVGARARYGVGEGAGEERGGGGTVASSASRQTRVRKFENTGWFHTYE